MSVHVRSQTMEAHVLSFLLVWALIAHTQVVVSTTNSSDVHALALVKAALDPASIQAGSCVSTWDFSVDPCDHLFGPEVFSCGIECAPDAAGTLRITSVKFDNSGYAGTLSPAIGNLSSLQFLQVSKNALSGSIPSSIGQLKQLAVLDISANLFVGTLPDALGLLQNLQSLNVADNQLGGVIPHTFIGLLSLLECRMQNNLFIGCPPDLSPLKQLQVLDLSSNLLSGRVPVRFPPNLISVSYRSNGLVGGLTKAHIDALSPSLNVLDLSGNQLSGPLDSSLFMHSSLQQLNLANNSFTRIVEKQNDMNAGTIKSQMIAVDISSNRVQGKLPHVFAHMPMLSSLSLSHNAFVGPIHESYALKAVAGMMGLQPLARLMLDGNYLSGPLPPLFMELLPENIRASFVDNCLANCPLKFFFCQGAMQKPSSVCRLFNANI